MTDIADVYWPKDMRVDRAVFREGSEQLRDDLGMGHVCFDETGKIIAADGSTSCYTNGPRPASEYNARLKKFTGYLNAYGFGIVAVRGQLIFGFGCMFTEAMATVMMHYRTDSGTKLESWTHVESLPDSDADEFERVVRYYEAALRKDRTVPLTFDDLVDKTSPLYGEWPNAQEPDYYVDLSENLRELYQTGTVADPDDYGMCNWVDNVCGKWHCEEPIA